MSTKQFISAEEHLAKIGVTVQQALNFIIENIEQPEFIFDVAQKNAVSLGMLSEITSYSTNVISEYFSHAKLDSKKLNDVSKLINSDLGVLEEHCGF